jgi:hypothetical protein
VEINMGHGFLQAIFGLPITLRQRGLLKQRPPIDAREFVKRIEAAGGDQAAGWIIHSKLLDWINVAGFTPYPDDNLNWVFGIAEEELDEDIILEILLQLKIEPPSREALSEFGAISTPIQIAKLVRRARVGI